MSPDLSAYAVDAACVSLAAVAVALVGWGDQQRATGSLFGAAVVRFAVPVAVLAAALALMLAAATLAAAP